MTSETWKVRATPEFSDWFERLAVREQGQVKSRVLKIEQAGHFGLHRSVGNDVWELKWKNGRRVYYAYIPEKNVLLLIGGNKNGQSRDISKAKRLHREYVEAC